MGRVGRDSVEPWPLLCLWEIRARRRLAPLLMVSIHVQILAVFLPRNRKIGRAVLSPPDTAR
ncbi:MAG: hypothetical protein DME18_04005 [Verrucomicrobia bacterium]|nr:MAG: hypothetical protein DME18_04005 [Verrucomicrobiota bacterium]